MERCIQDFVDEKCWYLDRCVGLLVKSIRSDLIKWIQDLINKSLNIFSKESGTLFLVRYITFGKDLRQNVSFYKKNPRTNFEATNNVIQQNITFSENPINSKHFSHIFPFQSQRILARLQACSKYRLWFYQCIRISGISSSLRS